MQRLQGLTAIVTGAARGIGRGIAERFIAEGARTVLVDLDRDTLERTVTDLGDAARAEVGSVADEAVVARAVASAIAWTGRLDVLVNNAAIANPYNAPVDQLAVAAWDRIIATNLTGAFLTTRAAAPHLRTARGSIINITSTRAFMSEPNAEAYAATKGGLVALTHALAISLGPDVRVNAIAPGWIATDPTAPLRPRDHAQHPVGRVGRPDDIAALAAYLASSEAGFVTGQTFTVDGGMTVKMIYEA
jgi:NAD(P)-dependent dehydrogenase (short-subunit alcohol dehydrogenase family)